jgi:proline iminopeptidase
MILMNPAPASTSDVAMFRKFYAQKLGPDMSRQKEILASAAYREGDPEAVAARYRLHFKPALKRPEDYEKLMATMKAAFVRQGKEGIVKARAVEDRLMGETLQVDGYDLLPRLQTLSIPTLVIWGDNDFFPREIAAHIARAIRTLNWSQSRVAGTSPIWNVLAKFAPRFMTFSREHGQLGSHIDRRSKFGRLRQCVRS